MNSFETQKAIIKFNRDTKEDKIKWEAVQGDPSSLGGTERLKGNVFKTRVLDKKIRLYRFEFRYYYEEELWQWQEGLRLEFIDGNNNTEWEFPADRTIQDLYDTVSYKTAKAEDFFSAYLNDDE